MSDRTVRIAVVGDEGVGKSSLVLAAVHNTFTDNPVPTLPATRLPANTVEGFIAPAPATLLIDTCSRPEEKQAWDLNAQQANAVVVAFAANDYNSLKRVDTHWIPELERVSAKRPMILCACKCDLGDIREARFREMIQHILIKHRYIETFLESSANKQQSIPDIFYYAVKSVVHPAEPLVEFDSGQLKPLCVKALKRIFMICDMDADGALDDEELNRFQVRCFNAPLQPTELQGVKDVVGERIPGGIVNNGLTLKGFLFLHALFIEKARTETVWTVLRSFGYSDELLIEESLLDTVNFSRQPDQVVEISSEGKRLLKRLFQSFDHNEDGLLSEAELSEMFSTAPVSPFDDTDMKALMVQTSGGLLLPKGFAARWAYMTAANPRKTLEHLMYLGLPMDPAFMQRQFSISKTRQQERRRGRDFSGRSVFQCYVFGPSGAGKTSLLEGLIREEGQSDGKGSSKVSDDKGPASHVAANEISVTRGHRQREVATTLILREMQASQLQQLEQDPFAFMEACDVAAFVFDNSSGNSWQSFLEAQQLMLKVAQLAEDNIPCVLVGAKEELGISTDVQEDISKAVQELRMQPPVQISASIDGSSDVYTSLLAAAIHPHNHIPVTPTLKARRKAEQSSRRTVTFMAASAVLVAGLYFGYQWSNSSDFASDSNSNSADSKVSAKQGVARSIFHVHRNIQSWFQHRIGN